MNFRVVYTVLTVHYPYLSRVRYFHLLHLVSVVTRRHTKWAWREIISFILLDLAVLPVVFLCRSGISTTAVSKFRAFTAPDFKWSPSDMVCPRVWRSLWGFLTPDRQSEKLWGPTCSGSNLLVGSLHNVSPNPKRCFRYCFNSESRMWEPLIYLHPGGRHKQNYLYSDAA